MKGTWRGKARRDAGSRGQRSGRFRLEMLESRCLLSTFVVDSIGDEPALDPNAGTGLTALGTITLRSAIQTANVNPGPDSINFSITPNGLQTIQPASALPTVTDTLEINGNTQPGTGSTPRIQLDGAGAGAGVDGLVFTSGNNGVRGLSITNFTGNGLVLRTNGATIVTGNHFGVTADGTTSASNGINGIFIDNSPNNTIGGTSATLGNVISGNAGSGILIAGPQAINNEVEGNRIGTNLAGTAGIPNGGDGIQINGATGTTIGGTLTGAANTIAFNAQNGVAILSGDGNSLRRNPVFANQLLGIELTGDANDTIPTPLITSVATRTGQTKVMGTLTGYKPMTEYVLEFFSSVDRGGTNQANARTYLGTTSVTTNSSGGGTFEFTNATTIAAGTFITATATENTAIQNTSEFAAAVENLTTTDLAITGTVSPDPVAQNGYLTFTYTVTNNGQLAADGSFSATLPGTLNYVQTTSTQGTVSRTGATVNVALGLLEPGASATVTILTVPLSVGVVSVTGNVTAPEDPNTGNNSVTLTANAVQGVNMVVQPSASPDPGVQNQELVFTYVVRNSGPATATDTIVRGTFPTTNVTFVSITASQGPVTANPMTGVFGAIPGTLAPGASALIRVVVIPTTVATYTSTATVTTTQPEIQASNNMATINVAVRAPLPPTPESLPPTVSELRRFGVHGRTPSITVGFNSAMDPARAMDLANYTLVTAGRDGRFGTADDAPIALRSAEYNTTTRTTILTTRRFFGLHQKVQLTVNGLAPNGLTNLDGVLLDGNFSGMAGSNFVRTFSAYGPGNITGPALAFARLRRSR